MKIKTIIKATVFILGAFLLTNACKKKESKTDDSNQPAEPRLIFRFKFDSTQARLDNLGNPCTVPGGHKAQSPKFNKMSAHYIELANDFDSLGKGKVLYWAPETTAGGSKAIDFLQEVKAGQGEDFFSIPLSQIPAGTYKWLRISLAYQNYDITFKSGSYIGTGTLASFLGYNTYITNYIIKTQSVSPSAAVGGQGNHLQGYWGFETMVAGTPYIYDGQAPAGATTVVNPMPNSPIPPGSCVVTGMFLAPSGSVQSVAINSGVTKDIVITVSLSTNNSFEWKEHSGDSYYEPIAGDTVVDMGIRGLKPTWNN